MTNQASLETQTDSVDGIQSDQIDEEFETAGDHHRMAAQHFSAAAKHHLLAAAADDEGDDETNSRHAFLAYRHQLNAVQYSEIAAMDNERPEDEFDIEPVNG